MQSIHAVRHDIILGEDRVVSTSNMCVLLSRDAMRKRGHPVSVYLFVRLSVCHVGVLYLPC